MSGGLFDEPADAGAGAARPERDPLALSLIHI